MQIDNTHLNDKNRVFYAPKIDCLTQTNGLKKSLHFVYHPCSIKQTELNPCSKTENLLVKRNNTIKNINYNDKLQEEISLNSESYLRFRTGWLK